MKRESELDSIVRRLLRIAEDARKHRMKKLQPALIAAYVAAWDEREKKRRGGK